MGHSAQVTSFARCGTFPRLALIAAFLLIAGRATAQSSPSLPSPPPPASNIGETVSRPADLSKSPDQNLAKAESLLKKGQLNDAEIIVREDLKTVPDSAAAHFLLGYILYREIQARAKQIDPNPNAVYAAPQESLLELSKKKRKRILGRIHSGGPLPYAQRV